MVAEPQAFDLNHIHRLGQEFHVEVVKAARNRALLEIYRPLRVRNAAALGLPRFYDHAWVVESVSDHLRILDAVAAGDAQGARRRVCDHLARGLEVRSRIFQSLAADAAPSPRTATWRS